MYVYVGLVFHTGYTHKRLLVGVVWSVFLAMQLTTISLDNRTDIYNPNQNTPGIKKVVAKNLKKAVLKKM